MYIVYIYIIHKLPTKRVLAPATKAHTLAYIAPRFPETSVGLARKWNVGVRKKNFFGRLKLLLPRCLSTRKTVGLRYIKSKVSER